MRTALGSDHRGTETKQQLINILKESGYEYKDYGTSTADPVDYPDIALKVCKAVREEGFDRGILVCDTGIGMSIAANKVRGIRAALCCDAFHAFRARLHNDANVMTIGTRHNNEQLREMLLTFLSTEFEGGRHSRRLDKIKSLENNESGL